MPINNGTFMSVELKDSMFRNGSFSNNSNHGQFNDSAFEKRKCRKTANPALQLRGDDEIELAEIFSSTDQSNRDHMKYDY